MAPCEGLPILILRFSRQKLETWYLWDFVKGHFKVMIIFRWQAHDSKVEIGVSPQRNTNFSHQGREKKHLIFEVFIWCDLKMRVSPQRNAHF